MQNLMNEEFAPVAMQEDVQGFTLLSLEDTDVLSSETDELNAAIESARGAAFSLAGIAEAVSATTEERGLTAEASVFAGLAANAALAPFGATLQTPSLESFDADGGRATATQFTLEGIKESAS